MEMVKTNIESLLSQGAALADIAIIARSNNTLQAIADYLAMELPTVRLVSNEAYRLDSSMAVEIIVNAMRYLVDTDNAVTAIYLQKAILTHIMGKTEEEANSIIAKEGSFAETLPAEYRPKFRLLPDGEGGSKHRQANSLRPLDWRLSRSFLPVRSR